MFRKTLFIFSLLLSFLALALGTVFASVGIKVDGTDQGSATTLNFTKEGATLSNDGSTYTFNLLLSGVGGGGAGTQTTSAVTVISTSYSVISMTVDGTVGTVNTLANGYPGQELTIIVVARTGSGTAVITPATKTGFSTVTTGAAESFVCLQYIDSTIGWIIKGSDGCTIT